MALHALKQFYDVVAAMPPPGSRGRSKVLTLPTLRRSDRSEVFRRKLAEIERKLTVDVDRWCAQMADARINFAKSVRELSARSPDVTKQLRDVDDLMKQYDVGDVKRNEIINAVESWIERQPPEVAGRPVEDIVFFQASSKRFVALLKQERDARRHFRNDLPGLKAKLLEGPPDFFVEGKIGPSFGYSDGGFGGLLLTDAMRCYDRIMEIASLPKGWHDGDGKKISTRAVAVAKEFVMQRPEMAGILYIYPTINGGILFEFEKGKWDLSLEILPSGTIELYGVRIDSDEVLEPLSFAALEPSLMKEINSRVGVQ
jgi:hypothetical protein